jgi:hypothetical protein
LKQQTVRSFKTSKSIGVGALGKGFGLGAILNLNEEEDEDNLEQEDQDEDAAIFTLYQRANNQSPSRFVFSPDGLFKTLWDTLIILSVIW